MTPIEPYRVSPHLWWAAEWVADHWLYQRPFAHVIRSHFVVDASPLGNLIRVHCDACDFLHRGPDHGGCLACAPMAEWLRWHRATIDAFAAKFRETGDAMSLLVIADWVEENSEYPHLAEAIRQYAGNLKKKAGTK